MVRRKDNISTIKVKYYCLLKKLSKVYLVMYQQNTYKNIVILNFTKGVSTTSGTGTEIFFYCQQIPGSHYMIIHQFRYAYSINHSWLLQWYIHQIHTSVTLFSNKSSSPYILLTYGHQPSHTIVRFEIPCFYMICVCPHVKTA